MVDGSGDIGMTILMTNDRMVFLDEATVVVMLRCCVWSAGDVVCFCCCDDDDVVVGWVCDG